MQKSGYGPAWMTPSALNILGFHPQYETLPTRRAFSFFSPCIWADDGGNSRLRRFLHKTGIGRLLVHTVWSILSKLVLRAHRILGDDLLSKLKPDCGYVFVAFLKELGNNKTKDPMAGIQYRDTELYGRLLLYFEISKRLNLSTGC
jgi:hypothetical protein